eukprot:2535761-Amphidinium_carterae.2
MVICGNRQPWQADERTSTNNLDASLLQWILSTWASKDTTWTTVDISAAFLTVKMSAEQLVLLKPPAVLVKTWIAQGGRKQIVLHSLIMVAELPCHGC